ncbi:aspartic peptidase domain-containing protein [Microdochium bolleyi]|uniref:Aspartic peptidase domain-containing protein n=1 Tax=Microdochium bolleyi TaxID=196109 RepID=A0A136IX30_9PEZI|nr:aspartic peptidase domain-containing protein [Microdochium bolleyi]
MLPSLSSAQPSRQGTLSKTLTTLAVAALSLASVSASPAPSVSVFPTVVGTEVLNNNGTANNSSTSSTTTVTQSASLLPIANSTTTGTSSSASATSSSTPPKGVLALPLRHVELGKGLVSGSIARRYFSNEVLSVYSAAYLAQIRFPDASGGESQVVDVLLDTGSFELFVNPVCSKSDVPDLCDSFGRYNASESSKSKALGSSFSIQYGGGSASGEYYKDSISLIPGTTLTEQQFGVANQSEKVWFGIMGLGQGRVNNYIKYPVILDSLKTQGFTESRLFSLELGPQAPASNPIQYSGEIVFGGLDRNKFAGNLRKIPTDPTKVYYSIKLTSLINSPASGVLQPVTRQANAQFPIDIIVDSGTTLTILPRSLVESLAAKFPGAQYDGSGGYTVPCSYREQAGSVTFGFGAFATISVSYRDFIWLSGNTCHLGASWSSSLNLNILGASFLRGAYVVFDQDNAALYMAPYRSCGGGSNLVAVPEGRDAAAGIVGACAPAIVTSSTTTATATSTSVTTTTRAATSATASATVLPIPDSSASRTGGAAPTTTITSTITRPVTYTITSCAAQRTGCTVGQVATRTAIFVTEICLAHQGNGVFVEIRPTRTAAVAATAAPLTITVHPGTLAAATATATCTSDMDTTVTVLPVTLAVAGASSSCTTGKNIAPLSVADFTYNAASSSSSSCRPSRTAHHGNHATASIRPVINAAANATVNNFAYTHSAADSTVTAAVIPLVSAAGSRRGVPAREDSAAGVFGNVDVKLAAGVLVAILGAWL